MAQFRSVPVADHGQKAFHVAHGLHIAIHIFIPHDMCRTPLQRPYDGNFCVLDKTDKYFKVDLEMREDNISINCLESKFME